MISPSRLAIRSVLVLICLGSFLSPVVRAEDQVDFTLSARPFLRAGSLHIVTADFNGDGLSDFAATNDSKVVVYFGEGTGDFRRPRFYAAGGLPRALTVADLNGDHSPDLVVANFDSISVLQNDGRGNFGALISFPGGESPLALTTGDFNRDGKTDVAVANSQSDNVTIMLGSGNGDFSSISNFPAGELPVSLVADDFNGDGLIDLAISSYESEEIRILRGDGSGGFSISNSYPLGGNGSRIVAADFNHDQLTDLAVGVYNIYPDNHMAVFLSNGDGTFTEAANIPAPDPQGLATADFNEDGNLDLVCTSYFVPTLVFALGEGDGQFSRPDKFRLPGNPFPLGIATADFNLDGKPDLAVSNYQAPYAAILLNLGTR